MEIRAIRFRAWDKERRVMIQPKDICHLDGETSNGAPTFMLLEQFTGLHDKAGREIFEGDILRLKETVKIWPPDIVYNLEAVDMVGIVRWCNEGADFEVAGQHDGQELIRGFMLDQEWEVLGNVHETPSLLEPR